MNRQRWTLRHDADGKSAQGLKGETIGTPVVCVDPSGLVRRFATFAHALAEAQKSGADLVFAAPETLDVDVSLTEPADTATSLARARIQAERRQAFGPVLADRRLDGSRGPVASEPGHPAAVELRAQRAAARKERLEREAGRVARSFRSDASAAMVAATSATTATKG